jgi:7-alpha-hydroxysteroid dehydrogenase
MSILNRFQLDGLSAVVTGAGKGIGRGIALALAEAGANVAVAARNADELAEVAKEIEALGRKAIAVPTDVLSEDQLNRLADRAEAAFGGIDIWVNNAGGLPDGTPRYLTRTSSAEWDGQVNLNLKAVWAGAVAAANHMKEKGGAIVNISSRASFGPQVKNGPYGASKAAVNSLTETLSVELAPNIRVNAVAPGPIPTQNFLDSMKLDKDSAPKFEKAIGIPLQRYGQPEDIGAAVVFMASPASSWVTGQCLYVTGGL